MKSIVFVLGLLSSIFVYSQNVEKIDTLNALDQRVTTLEDAIATNRKLKLSGYLQPQFQSAQIDSTGNGPKDMKVGTGKNASENESYNRFGIRRGRLKATYEDLGSQGVLEFEMTEKGITLKNGYVSVLDPWLGILALKGGVYDRPFGYEIAYSSSRIESPERSRIIQTLFPDESDLGGMITLQAPKTSNWNALKLEAGLFAGNGISQDNDSKKDFIGHLSFSKSRSNIKYGLGLSFYSGSIFQPTKYIYSMDNNVFVADSTATNKNKFANRQYLGFDGQISINSGLGMTTLRGEYITGTQPGSSSSSNSPNATTVVTADTYLRSFEGGYIHFVHDIAGTKHSIAIKYDWYDPNTRIAGDNIGVSGSKTGKADMAYTTLGFGYIYRMNSNVKLTAYYDIIANETTRIKGYFSNVNDNLLTLRMQYKF